MAVLTASGISRAHGVQVVLEGVSLTVGPGSRVGVVGPNGVGKSTLLRILAGLERADAGRLTLAPPTLTVGYLAQEPTRQEATGGQEPTRQEATGGQEPARPEATPPAPTGGTEEAGGPAGETLFASLARRTGVARAEADLDRTAGALATAAPGADDDYAGALDRYLALGGPDLRARAGAVCDDLGLPVDRLDVELGALSGGEAARAALAAILLSRFDILLLDEPTNDLDFAGLDRLERFVAEAPGGLVIVSHDRAFLERTIATVVELDEHDHTATTYGGGWAAYLEAKAVARRHAEEAHTSYVRSRESLQERAREQRQWAVSGVRGLKKNPPDRDKAQRGFFVNRTEKQAAKVRITEKALDRLEAVDKPWEGWVLDLAIAEAPRSGQVVARLEQAVVQQGSFRLGPVDLEVSWRERIAILGPNGSGKTTLLRAILGQAPLVSGQRYLGPAVVVGELDQARRRFLGGQPLLDAFASASGLVPRESRSLLAKFGLTAEHVARSAESLSPGERTRAELALLMARGVNCLVLDEPTNHLDLPAIEQLESALERYDGTLLLVTHDRRLLETVSIDRTVDLTPDRAS